MIMMLYCLGCISYLDSVQNRLVVGVYKSQRSTAMFMPSCDPKTSAAFNLDYKSNERATFKRENSSQANFLSMWQIARNNRMTICLPNADDFTVFSHQSEGESECTNLQAR